MEDATDTNVEADDGGNEYFADAQAHEAICYGHQPMQTPDGMRCVRCNARLEWNNQEESERHTREATSGPLNIAFDLQDYSERGVQQGNTTIGALTNGALFVFSPLLSSLSSSVCCLLCLCLCPVCLCVHLSTRSALTLPSASCCAGKRNTGNASAAARQRMAEMLEAIKAPSHRVNKTSIPRRPRVPTSMLRRSLMTTSE